MWGRDGELGSLGRVDGGEIEMGPSGLLQVCLGNRRVNECTCVLRRGESRFNPILTRSPHPITTCQWALYWGHVQVARYRRLSSLVLISTFQPRTSTGRPRYIWHRLTDSGSYLGNWQKLLAYFSNMTQM